MKIAGIQTNNLKNLNFSTTKSEIIGLYGISGGGKSSLAFSTLYKLCSESFNALEHGFCDEGDYIVQEYENLMPSIAIKQLNLNSNPKSTLYSYLNCSSILSSLHEIEYSRLKLNKIENECKECLGTGQSNSINLDLVINWNESLYKNPFIPWKTKEQKNDKYETLLDLFCQRNNINQNKTLLELDDKTKELLLYSKDNFVFKYNFKHNNKKRVARASFIGIVPFLNSFLESEKKSLFAHGQKYTQNVKCYKCNGSRVDFDIYGNIHLEDISFYDFLTKSIDELLTKQFIKQKKYIQIKSLFESLSKLGIGYLNLVRSIPSLSGGELQKIHFANLINSKMSGLLIVVDEITNGLHIDDIKCVANYIKEMKNKNNTLVLVEHNEYMLKQCDRLFCIGPQAGVKGGYIIDNCDYVSNIAVQKNILTSYKDFVNISNITYNNVYNENVSFPINAITAIVGKSGSGKSSLARFINQTYKNTIFVSQKSLQGNSRSTISSYLGINKEIASIFGNFFNKDYSFFMPNAGSEIVCSVCNGTGIVKYERSFERSIVTKCNECDGELFNNKANDYKYDSVTSIKNLYTNSLSELDKLPGNKILELVTYAKKLGLSHLSLNRKINTLSGGETKRIKILKSLIDGSIKNKILIIDEPSAGLDFHILANIIELLQDIKNKTQAIIIIDHNPFIFFNSDYIIEIGPGSGINGGKITYSGSSRNYYINFKDKYSEFYDNI
ncbi:ATP-binding cassette domain-containing protein [Campylobacter coli]|nr:ATP-binding cassette domain-containing protein [Campylobacter coli]